MARDGSGNYSIPNTFTPNTTIASTAMNANFSDIATAMTGSLARNSEGPMTAALVMHQNGFNYDVDPDTGIKRTAANEQAIFCGGANVVVVGTATVSIAIAVNIIGALAIGGALALGNTMTVTGSSANFVAQELISTDAGALNGPNVNLYRNSASPAASDVLGLITWYGNDSGANKTAYGEQWFQIADATNGSEDGQWFVRTMINGVQTVIMNSSAAQIQIPGSLAVTGAITGPAGNWTLADLAQTAKAFQAAQYHIRDQRASGTDGDVLTANAWNTRTMQTEVIDELTITLAANQFALVAGTYQIKATAVAYFAGSAENGGANIVESRLRLRNITDGTTIAAGLATRHRANADAGGSRQAIEVSILATLDYKFTIAATKTFELQNYVASNLTATVIANTQRGGKALTASAESEVYADLQIWKVG